MCLTPERPFLATPGCTVSSELHSPCSRPLVAFVPREPLAAFLSVEDVCGVLSAQHPFPAGEVPVFLIFQLVLGCVYQSV